MKTLLLLLLPFKIFAQDLTGVWTGFIQSGENKLTYELAISADKDEWNGYALTIFTFNGKDNMGIKSIRLKNKNGKIALEDHELVYDNYSTPPKKVKLLASLFLKKRDTVFTLDGSFFTRSLDFREQNKTGFTGTIHLQKQNHEKPTELMAKLDELNLLSTLSFAISKINNQAATVAVPEENLPPLKEREKQVAITPFIAKISLPVLHPAQKEFVVVETAVAETEPLPLAGEKQKRVAVALKTLSKINIQPAAFAKQKNIVSGLPVDIAVTTAPNKQSETPVAAAQLAERKTEIIRSVFFSGDSLVLSLYDNGTIDGDTVSVVLNGKVILAKKGLTANAIRTTVYVTPDLGDSLQLVMYAENLGSIPPNTGLLIVQDGNSRNEIRFAGDMQKSSAVILRRRR
ncbi:MAG: hypothetical protein ACTHOF_01140 [Flavisolibacter sp.]|jgi:hypothetical protein